MESWFLVRPRTKVNNTSRFRVGLGVIPDYLFDGKGMRIDGISEGSLHNELDSKREILSFSWGIVSLPI